MPFLDSRMSCHDDGLTRARAYEVRVAELCFLD